MMSKVPAYDSNEILSIDPSSFYGVWTATLLSSSAHSLLRPIKFNVQLWTNERSPFSL